MFITSHEHEHEWALVPKQAWSFYWELVPTRAWSFQWELVPTRAWSSHEHVNSRGRKKDMMRLDEMRRDETGMKSTHKRYLDIDFITYSSS